ncbi:hypothetical protein C2845_PM13G05760 [Panicum miliaceum]|uniref:Uncharacterized protein n=1 Tax=Panicum miliaceum TaxID=4540 RepID=A0A3L6RK53_PANMI|nr:hypothetical protein C2845_PM13G05760 [Panicum miliaceum]
MATGLIVVLLAVSAGVNFSGGGFGLLLSFAGVLAGANNIAAGVAMADDPAPAPPVGPAAFAGARALAAFLRRHLAVVGLAMASSAVTAVAGEAGPVLCFGMLALLLLALSLTTVGVLGE